MSLIADALRKADAPVTAAPPSSPAPKKSWSYWGIGALALLVVLGVRIALRPSGRPSSNPPGSAAVPRVESPAPVGLNLLRSAEGQWRLNGIVQGGSGKSLALINGQVVEEGGSVSGAQVTRVASDQVELETENGQSRTLKFR